MSYQVQRPKTARDAIQYFHAVALDYVTNLKKQFPNHNISIEPSCLSYHPLTQLNIEVRVWDRTLHIKFEIFAEQQWDQAFNEPLRGKGSISLAPYSYFFLYLLDHGNYGWLYSGKERNGKTLDADFLLDQMKPLLDQLPD